MAIKINFDANHNPETPTVELANRNGKILGQLEPHEIVLKDCFNTASEIQFVIYKELDCVKCHLWEDIQNFQLIYCKEWNSWFEIEVELNEQEINKIYKNVYCKTLGKTELSQIMLYDIEINTESDIARDNYIPTILWNKNFPQGSLLHRITEKAPHYSVIHVDSTIASIQRTFTFNETSIDDAFNNISEEIGCLFVYHSESDDKGNIQRTISVYDIETHCNSCGFRGEFTYSCPDCSSTNLTSGFGNDTTIFITSDKLANDIQLTVDVDSVKNCFKLEAGDDLMTATIMNCNPNGTGYIWHLSDDMRKYMSNELVAKIDSYNQDCNYYQNDYSLTANKTLFDEYNALVNKYKSYKKDLEIIAYPVTGYTELMKAYYGTVDLANFLRSSLMPDVSISDTSAKKQSAKLTKANISPVAVTDASKISLATANSAVLAMAKVIIDSTRYQIKINTSSISSLTWTGNFILTNYSDEEDTAVSELVDIEINDDYEAYVFQKIQKALNSSTTSKSPTDIVGLFALEYSAFCNELHHYCLVSLNTFADCAQACIDILVEQEIADSKSWAGSEQNLYESLYVPYYKKLEAIQAEMSLRENEVNAVQGLYDEEGNLIKQGLRSFIVKERDAIQDKLNFDNYLGTDLALEFASYRREDKYTNSNYISDGLTNAELFSRAMEFITVAKQEASKSAEKQLSISTNLKNLLVLEEFKPILDYFQCGNWLRIQVDDEIYQLRLISYEIDYDNLDSISVEFSDVSKNASGSISDKQSILKQMQSMSTSYRTVIKQCSTLGNELSDFTSLANTNFATTVGLSNLSNTVDYLQLETASIKYVKANYAAFDYLTANYASFYQLQTTNAIIDNLYAKVAMIDYVAANYAALNEFTALKGTVDSLTATSATVTYLAANYATLQQLAAANAKIDYLNANAVMTDFLKANYATINYLSTNYATIVNLQAVNANIQSLSADFATINTLLNGNLTSQNIQSLHITATNTVFDNAVINNAAIASVSADKLTAGTIYTNLINVQSQNGQLYIADNTIQIKDSNRARVQIGEDAAGDYSMYVWDASGNLMFDALGLHESGIKSGIIKDSMVSDSANISAYKLDVSTLNSVVNNGSVTINSSNVLLDTTGQRLNVAFTAITTLAETTAETLDNLSIGGRNLFLYSGDFSKGWTILNAKSYSTTSNDVPLTGTSAKTYTWTNTAATSGLYHRFRNDAGNTVFTNGQKYAISFWVKASGQVDFYVAAENIDSGKYVKTTTEWQYVTYTFTGNGTGHTIVLYGRNLSTTSTTTFWLSMPMLVEGDVPVTWSPAPEDVDSEISTITSSIQTLTTDLSVVQGQISAKIWSTDITTAITPLNTSITSLSDQYTALNATIGGITATVANHTSQIASKADGTTVTSLQTQVSDLTLSYEGFKTTVSNTYVTQTEFDALSVGGRNYVLNSVLANSGSGYRKQSNDTNRVTTFVDNGYADGVGYAELTATGITTDSWFGYTGALSVSALVDGKYTASGWYYIDSSVELDDVIFIEIKNHANNKASMAFSLPMNVEKDKWNYFTVSATTHSVNNTYTPQEIYVWLRRNGKVRFALIKIEQGNRATDWSPAPEDTDTALTSLTQTVTNQTTLINQNTAAIALKASQSTVDTLTSRVSAAESSLTVQSGTITALNSLVDGHTTQIGSLQSSYDGLTSTVTAVQYDLDNLEVGGRNLFLYSGDFSKGWTILNAKSYSTTSNDVPLTGTSAKTYTWTNTAATSGHYHRFRNDAGNTVFISGQKYAISFWVKASGQVDFQVSAELIDNGKTVKTTTEWQYVTYTFTGNGTGHTIVFYGRNLSTTSTTTFYLSMPMLVEGDVPVSWSPAPEDMATLTQYTSLSQTVESIGTSVTNLSNSTSSQITQLSNQITSVVTDLGNLSVGGRNYLCGTAEAQVITGNGGTNQTSQKYFFPNNSAVANGIWNLSGDSVTVTISFDWVAVGSGFAGTFFVQTANTGTQSSTIRFNGLTGKVTLSDSNTKGRVTNTVTLSAADADSRCAGFRLDNVPSTVTLTFSNMKLEKGNVATDWSPALEDMATKTQYTSLSQTVESISTNVTNLTNNTHSQITQLSNKITSVVSDFNNLNIGTRNLLIGSSAFTKDTPYKLTGTSNDTYVYLTNLYCDLEAGVEYMVSAKTDGMWTIHSGASGTGGNKCAIFFVNQDRSIHVCATKAGSTSWSFTPSKTLRYHVRLNVYASGDVVNFWDLQVEKGNLATDWSPAPEDMATLRQFTSLSQTLDTISSNVTNLTNNTNSQITQLSNQISSVVSDLGNLSVGGRNMLRQSGRWTTLPDATYWQSNGGGISLDSTVLYTGYPTLKTSLGAGIKGYHTAWIELDTNKTYTYSALIRSDTAINGTSVVPLHAHSSINKTTFVNWVVGCDIIKYEQKLVAGEWTKLYVTFKPKSADYKYWRPFVYYGSTVVCTINIAYLQLEEGNTATDWSPAPEDMTTLTQHTSLSQTVESIGTNVTNLTNSTSSQITQLSNQISSVVSDLGNLSVGGRNYILNSALIDRLIGYDWGNSTVRETGDYTLIHKAEVGTGRSFFYKYPTESVVLEDDTYTFSAWVYIEESNGALGGSFFVRSFKSNGDMVSDFINIALNDSNYPVDQWFKVSGTGKPASDTGFTKGAQVCLALAEGFVGKVRTKKWKLEKGNKATDWSPAPEDTDNAIASVSTSYTQLSNKFSWLVESGNHQSNFTLTSRTAQLVADQINLSGLVTFSGLNSSVQSILNTANNVNSTIADWCYNNDTTYINGGKIYTGSITADKIAAGAITSDKLATNAILVGFNTIGKTIQISSAALSCYTSDSLNMRISSSGFYKYDPSNSDPIFSITHWNPGGFEKDYNGILGVRYGYVFSIAGKTAPSETEQRYSSMVDFKVKNNGKQYVDFNAATAFYDDFNLSKQSGQSLKKATIEFSSGAWGVGFVLSNSTCGIMFASDGNVLLKRKSGAWTVI